MTAVSSLRPITPPPARPGSRAAIHLILSPKVAALLVAALAGCGPPAGLVIASPHRDEIRDEFGRAFGDWYRQRTGRPIEVVWLDLGGGTSAIRRWIQARFEAGYPDAAIDIMFGGGTDPYVDFKKRGYLQACPVPDEIRKRIPPAIMGVPLYDPDGFWYGTCLTGFGLLYNKQVLQRMQLPEPRTWSDLGRSVYFNWIAAGDPRQSGTLHMLYEIMLQALGWQEGFNLVTRISGNVHAFERDSGEVVRAVGTGDSAVAGATDFYAFSLMSRVGDDLVGFLLPEGQTVISADSIGVIKGAPHHEAAEAFVEFVLSDEGQQLWMLRHGQPGGPRRYDLARLAVLPTAYETPAERLTVHMNPFQIAAAGGPSARPMQYDNARAGARWDVLNDLLGAALIDAHEELQTASRALITAAHRGADPTTLDELWDQLGRPPCDERELTQFGGQISGDPRRRNELLAQWTLWARGKYRQVAFRAAEVTHP